MQSYKLLLLSLVVVTTHAALTLINTSPFWTRQLNVSALNFECFAGSQSIDWFYPKGQASMFYQLYGAMDKVLNTSNPTVPLIIWLQGGPGSSSQFGAFTQIGPIRINKGKPELAAYPWNRLGHLLFIDQPLNVGFSFNGERRGTGQVSTANIAATHLMNFLVNFYTTWPSLRDSPLYITGESFAGHYIPALARTIIMNATFQAQTKARLVGIAIGDGWTDPINQMNYYDSYLYSVGVVSNKFRDICTWFQTNSIVNIYEGNYKNATAYFDFLTNNDTTAEQYWGGISIFNFRNYNGLDVSFAKFLEDNKGEFLVNQATEYIRSNDAVYEAFAGDITRSYAVDVSIALRYVKVLIYNGQEDMVVNNAGVLQYLNSLSGVNIELWKRAAKQVWTIRGNVRGWAKVGFNLWFVLVNRAGHMVPTDQPQSAFAMLSNFLNDRRSWNL